MRLRHGDEVSELVTSRAPGSQDDALPGAILNLRACRSWIAYEGPLTGSRFNQSFSDERCHGMPNRQRTHVMLGLEFAHRWQSRARCLRPHQDAK
jgi:hypothetical protein